MSRVGYLIAIAIASGCVGDVAIGRGVCGNWVLEAGEDCDRPDGVCTADCRIHCNPVAPARCFGAFDGACCPDGFACGVDQACHAPGGALASAPISVPVDLTAFRVGDIDGDHIGDILGVGPDAIHALYGSAHAPLSIATTRSAPPSTGVPAIGDYTGDGRLDVVWPVAAGLLAFDTASGGPEPVPFPSGITPGIDHVRIAAASTGLVRLDHTAADNRLVILDDRGSAPHILCNHGEQLQPELLGGRSIHPYNDGNRTLIPFIFAPSASNPGVPPFICVDGPGSIGTITSFAPANTTPSDVGEAFYARLDLTAACPDLVVPVAFFGTPALVAYTGTGTAGTCNIITTNPAIELVGAPLAAIALASGDPAIVTSQGVFGAGAACGGGTNLCGVLAATRAWRYAVVADFDGDGLDDFAVASPATDVEVFLQTSTGWIARRIATGGPAIELAAGDFDGDGILDLAIAIVDPTAPRSASVRFAFGGGGAFVVAGTPLHVDDLNGMAMAPLDDPALPPSTDRVDDLVLVAGTDTVGTVTRVYGSVDRSPTVPWSYLGTFDTGISLQGQAVVAITGPFGTDSAAGIFGIFAPSPSASQAFSGALEVANLSSESGTLTARRQARMDPCQAGNFCPTTARFVTVPQPDGAFVIGFAGSDDTANCGGFYHSTPDSQPRFAALACTDTSGGLVLRRLAYARALGDDGTGAQLVALATPTELSTWTVGIDRGAPAFTQVFDVTAVVGDAIHAPVSCTDAVGIELGTRTVDDGLYGAGRELAAACRAGAQTLVFAIFAPPTPMVSPLVVQLFALDETGPIELEVGDVNGDGVDDLMYTTRTGGVGMLHARLQCDSHATCEGP